jgi:O-antigen ligase
MEASDPSQRDYPCTPRRQPTIGMSLADARTALPARPAALPALIAGATFFVALLAGALLTRSVGLGIALVGGCVFVTLVLLDLPLAIAAWVPVAWIEYSHLTGRAPVVGTVLLVVAWLGVSRARGVSLDAGGAVRPVMLALGVFLVWLTLSVAWSGNRSVAWKETKDWYGAAAAFFLVATALGSARTVRLVAFAFVAGALIAVVVGLSGHGGLTTTADAVDLATRRRFSGGAGDPNYLAAGLVAAIALAAGLLPSVRDPIAKVGVGAAIAALALALAATESRGGIIGAAAALVVAVGLARGQRAEAAAFGVFVVIAAGAFFLASPSALERATNFNGGGGGRTELWLVAWRMSEDHPLVGVGIANFRFESHNYVREPGSLKFVRLIVDEPLVAHNVYLQQLAETGIVGLALLLSVIAACLTAAVRAARRFDALGDSALATLARASAIAMVGFLVASTFISDGTDKRLWIVLALGPALLGLARRHAAPSRTST